MYHREPICKQNPLRILCATDFSTDSKQAFHHALALSLHLPTELTLLHVGAESRNEVPWDRFPDALELLMRWGKLARGSKKSDLEAKLGVRVNKRAMRDEDPAFGIIDHIRKFPTDLLVMNTRPPTGFARLVKRSVAGQVLRDARVNSLLLPKGCRSFIDERTGASRLSHILWPIDHEPDPRPPMAYALQLLQPMLQSESTGSTLYVGEPRYLPDYRLPTTREIEWTSLNLDSEIVPGIFKAADHTNADLVVMPTAGRDGLAEKVQGSTIEQVLRWLGRPLLAMPAD